MKEPTTTVVLDTPAGLVRAVGGYSCLYTIFHVLPRNFLYPTFSLRLILVCTLP